MTAQAVPATTPAEWRARPLGRDDERPILELFKTVFGGSMTPEQWRRQFPGNPFSRPIVYLAETPDGRIVGHYSLIPVPFVKDGKSGLAALSIQSMIHPDFQRRGILKRLAAVAESQLDADGVSTGITFLNDNSLHAYTQHFAWTELPGPNVIYFTVLDSKAILQRVLKMDALAGAAAALVNPPMHLVFRGRTPGAWTGRIREVAKFDERVDDLWRSFARGLRFAVDRTARYLNWRVVDKPGDYSRFVAEDGDQLKGLVVTKTERKFGVYFGYIVELMYEPSAPDVGRRLVAHALEHLKTQGCSMATALTAGSDDVRRTLRHSGFWRLPRKAMPHGIHFCFKDRESKGPPPTAGWYLSWSDHDVV